MIGDEPQPIDQAIEHVVAVLLQERPNLDRQEAHDAIMETVENLLAESS